MTYYENLLNWAVIKIEKDVDWQNYVVGIIKEEEDQVWLKSVESFKPLNTYPAALKECLKSYSSLPQSLGIFPSLLVANQEDFRYEEDGSLNAVAEKILLKKWEK